MRIGKINLQCFRNVEQLSLSFDGSAPALFVGSNGQGKSNILEAIAYVGTLRSFRTFDTLPLIQKGSSEAGLWFDIRNDSGKCDEVEIRIQARTKRILVNGTPVTRLADYIGMFPTLAFNVEDSQWIKGEPQYRRKAMDLFLSMMDPEYLDALSTYHKALKARNQALKNQSGLSVVRAFSHVMAPAAFRLVEGRRKWVDTLTPILSPIHRHLVSGAESVSIDYAPSCTLSDPDAFNTTLRKNETRDSALGSTSTGPHRDDFAFTVDGSSARSFGSEGQQRTLILAFKLAQLDLLESRLNQKAVVLLDDVFTDLDPARQQQAWSAFSRGRQIIASGTVIPDVAKKENWTIFSVCKGRIEPYA